MGLAECDAGHAAGDQAGVDGLEAVEEGGLPALGTFRGLGVDGFAGLGQEGAEALRPTREVLLVDRAVAGGLLLGGGHYDFGGSYGKQRLGIKLKE